jgi:dienelactone hydrolase
MSIITRRDFVFALGGLAVGIGGMALVDRQEDKPDALLLFPDGYVRKRTPVVFYHHGRNEDKSAPQTDTLKVALISHLIANGYAIFSISAHGNNWGSPAAQQDYIDAWAWLQTQMNVSRLVFLGQSMGGLTSLTLAARGVMPVSGWAGIYPACNLADMHATALFTAEVRKAYGIADDGSDYDLKTSDQDPVKRIGIDFDGLPMRFYASDGDTIVNKSLNSDLMSKIVAGHASEYEVVGCAGEHGDPSHFQNDDLLSFFDRCV